MTSEEYYEQGKIHWEAGEYDEAEEHFAQALELEPEWARAWHGLGRLYFSREQYEEAVDAFQQSTALEEENPIHWLSLARAYTYLKLPNEALEAYQKSVKLNRQAAAPWNGLGVLYFEALGKPQNGVQCFRRAEYLGKDEFAGNLYAAFAQLPPFPFFSFRIVREYMPAEEYGKWKGYLQNTFETALPLAAYLNWLEKERERGGLPKGDWYKLLGLVHYYMGDPAAALDHFVKSQEQSRELDLMVSYYQLLACWDFLEPDAPYLEPALERAAEFLPPEQSSWKFWQKKEEAAPLLEKEFTACYYAGLIFVEHDELEKALLCFERIEQDFLPAAYQAFWCCEELMLGKKKKEKGEFLLAQEAGQQQFINGLQPQPLDLDAKQPLSPFLQAIRYIELEEGIERLHMYAEFEGTPQEYEIQNATDQPAFYQLWQLSPEDEQRATALLLEGLENPAFREQVEAFLRGEMNGGEEEE